MRSIHLCQRLTDQRNELILFDQYIKLHWLALTYIWYVGFPLVLTFLGFIISLSLTIASNLKWMLQSMQGWNSKLTHSHFNWRYIELVHRYTIIAGHLFIVNAGQCIWKPLAEVHQHPENPIACCNSFACQKKTWNEKCPLQSCHTKRHFHLGYSLNFHNSH